MAPGDTAVITAGVPLRQAGTALDETTYPAFGQEAGREEAISMVHANGAQTLDLRVAEATQASGQEATVTLRDAAIFLRYNDRFTEDTLTVRITTLSPDSLRFEEEFLLAIVRTDTPAALQHETLIPYRRQIRLLREGGYRILVTPVRPVRGVEAVGVRLAKSY